MSRIAVYGDGVLQSVAAYLLVAGRGLLAGYSSHLPKPIEPAQLAAVVANLAGRTARN